MCSQTESTILVAATYHACAGGVYGPHVVLHVRELEAQRALRHQRGAEAGGARRVHAVVHVRAQRAAHHDVQRVPARAHKGPTQGRKREGGPASTSGLAHPDFERGRLCPATQSLLEN